MELRSLKQHLIDELRKVDDENVLKSVRQVLKERRKKPARNLKLSDFSGIWKDSEAEEMKRIIADGCEQINEEDWR